nr:hypothetical protein FVER53263_20114 [Fusarium verticillioides]
MTSQTKKQLSKPRVRKSRSTTTKQLKPKTTALSSCLFCLRNRRKCLYARLAIGRMHNRTFINYYTRSNNYIFNGGRYRKAY